MIFTTEICITIMFEICKKYNKLTRNFDLKKKSKKV